MGPLVCTLPAQPSTFSWVERVMRLVYRTGGKEFASILSTEASANLEPGPGIANRSRPCDGGVSTKLYGASRHPSHHFHFDDILARKQNLDADMVLESVGVKSARVQSRG
jgi:hypothetical protein